MNDVFVVNNKLGKCFKQQLLNFSKSLRISDALTDDFLLLIDNESDYSEFINHFWEGEGRQLFSLSSYRNYKLSHTNYKYSDFKSDYESDKQKAIERLFLRKTKPIYINILEQKIKDGSMNLEKLYMQHVNDPDFRFEWIVNRKN